MNSLILSLKKLFLVQNLGSSDVKGTHESNSIKEDDSIKIGDDEAGSHSFQPLFRAPPSESGKIHSEEFALSYMG